MTDAAQPFREESLKKAADPEQLNRYVKVTGSGPWLEVAAAAQVLAAIFAWAFFGTVQTVIEGAGYCKDGIITGYFSQDTVDDIPKNAQVDIHGQPGVVVDTNSDLYLSWDVPNDILYLLPQSDSRWYATLLIRCDLPDGLYSVKYYGEEVHPISFLTQGNES